MITWQAECPNSKHSLKTPPVPQHTHTHTHAHTHPTPNLPSAEIFSLHNHDCCLPCHPHFPQANSKLIHGVLFSTVEVRHGEKQGDVANMWTQEEMACVVWLAEENSICILPEQRVLKNNSHPIWSAEGITTWDRHEAWNGWLHGSKKDREGSLRGQTAQ